MQPGERPANMLAFVNALDYQMSAWAHPAFNAVEKEMHNKIWEPDTGHNGTIPAEVLLQQSQTVLQRVLDDYFASAK
jgi:hypothetical protein